MSNVKEILKEIAEANALSQRMDGKMSLDEAEMYIKKFTDEDETYTFEEDELMEYLYLDKNESGLNVDCFVDDGGSFKLHNHDLWLLVRNGYSKDDFNVLPIKICSNPTIQGNYDIKISQDDLKDVYHFIIKNQGILIAFANRQIKHLDFYNHIGQDNVLRMAEDNIHKPFLLTEMATFRKEDSGLPMDIWIDDGGTYKQSGHGLRIKFNSIK